MLVAATAVGLSACSTFDNTGVAAEVAGADISADRYEEFLQIYFERGDAFGTTPAENGRVSADQSRFLLAVMVRQQLFRTFTEQRGVDVTEDREAFKSAVIAPSPLGELGLPDEMLDLIADVDDQLLSESLGKVSAPNIDALRSAYAANPSGTGVTCVRHILVETEAEAEAVLDELASGADFSALAELRSTDQSAVGQGGAIQGPDGPCIPLETIRQGFDPAFVDGMLDAREGVPSSPVESSFGWHVILHRPWAEVGDAVGAAHSSGDAGQLLFAGYAATAEVDIDPRYGTWNPVARSVEPLG